MPANLPQPAGLRELSDAAATRTAIHDRVLESLSTLPDVTHQNLTLRLRNPQYLDPERFGRKEERDALLTGRTLGRRIRGTWELVDNTTGEVVDSRNQIVARVPYLTDLGVFVHRGNQWTLKNQQRLRAGTFARRKRNGELSAHVNILPGKGLSHQIALDPDRGRFTLNALQANIPLMPLLRSLGATDQQLRAAWGRDLLAANQSVGHDGAALKRIAERVLRASDLQDLDDNSLHGKLKTAFESMELDPEVMKRTLGKPYERLNLEVLLDLTSKLAKLSRGEVEPDSRDHLAFQTFPGPEDLMSERLTRDWGSLRRKTLWKLAREGNLAKLPSGLLTEQLEAALAHSGLGQALEEVNPSEIVDKITGISRMGEGGIPSMDAVPDEARAVHDSQFGFLDPIGSPESERIGVELYIARGARKGKDGKLYSQFRDVRTGQNTWMTPQDAADQAIAFPGALKAKTRRVWAVLDGKMQAVDRRRVRYELPHMEEAFRPLDNLIPFKSAAKGQRDAMGSRMTTQALPLTNAEAPLVQAGIPGTGHSRSYEQEYGTKLGALRAQKPGTVQAVTEDGIQVRFNDGTSENYELYRRWPFNRKTYFHQEPVVQTGQAVKPGDLLARSNYTDRDGQVALGLNARVVYIPWRGYDFEDAAVVSESFAKRATSEHMYQHEASLTDGTHLDKRKFVGLFPGAYDRRRLDSLDDRGVVQPGQTVRFGDPLVLLVQERAQSANRVHRKRQSGYRDASLTWDHHDPGVVTDVLEGKEGPVVLVKTTSPAQVGDKISGRYGDKHIIAAVLPDSEMPHDRQGQPFEVAVSPEGITSRINPAQAAEAALGKIAARTGQPYRVADFDDINDLTEYAQQELRRHGLDNYESVVDPETERAVREPVLTGVRYYMKLHHMAEHKGQGRATGAYTQEGAPAKGGPEGAKRLALTDINALMSHGATENVRDRRISGQANPEWWIQYLQGHTPPEPQVPQMYEKFVHKLQASGIQVVPEGGRIQVMAMTDRDIEHLAEDRELENASTVRDHDDQLTPVAGGLFDEKLTGGHNGRRWSFIRLTEPLPNPVMEEPVRRLLGLTQKRFEAVLSGQEQLHGQSGPRAIQQALEHYNVPLELAKARVEITQSRGAKRDSAVRRLSYLKAAQRLELHPKDWILSKVPVLPPLYRPISIMADNKLPLVADANLLYRELFDANQNLKGLQGQLQDQDLSDERLALYNSFKAVTGLGDPVSRKAREKGLKGILKTVFGSSPKFGDVQRKLLSGTIDVVGRAVVTPNPDYDMDTVGLPEDKAFEVYRPMIARELRRRGMPLRQALQQAEAKTPLAREILLDVMQDRPVRVNRAPVLHKFGILAFWPKLVKGNTLQVSPLIHAGFNLDHDGDMMNYSVPLSEEARQEAIDKMLPSRSLLSPSDYKTPVHSLRQDYLAGVYEATNPDPEKRTRVFASKEHALAALRRHEIGYTDPIEILG